MGVRIRDGFQRWELLLILVGRNLKIRYQNSVLGFFWTLLAPLFLIVIYALFLKVMRFPIDLRVLITGILAWQFLGMCMGDAAHAIVGNANLVTKAAFPRMVLPGAMVAANLVNFLLSGAVLIAYLLIVRADFGCVLLAPLIVVSQTALCLGVSLMLSTANVFFRDTEHLVSVLMLAWFFVTPVIYPVEIVLENPQFGPLIHTLFYANPMTGIVSAYRAVLLSESASPAHFVLLPFAVAWAVLVLGILVFRRAEPLFGDEL